MTNILLIGQDKGGVGKTFVSRGAAELAPLAQLLEIDSSPRMIELAHRVSFFPTRADRSEIERTGGAASREEFDAVINTISEATLPTIVDIGANTSRPFLQSLRDVEHSLTERKISLALLVVTTAEPGALAEVPWLLSMAEGWTSARFLIENKFKGEIDTSFLDRFSRSCIVSTLPNMAMDEHATVILQAGGISSITALDRDALNSRFGLARGARVWRDLSRARLEVMRAVEPAVTWLLS